MILKMNSENLKIVEFTKNKLKREVLKIKDYKKSRILDSDKLIPDWDQDTILQWMKEAKKVKDLQTKKGIREVISVISRGNFLLHDYYPRFTQIITILLIINTGENGLLMQVSTGEGKSLIVSMLAVIKCLQGHTVDIVTSSPILAKRDAVEMKEFYQMFGLTVADNQDTSGGTKKCYAMDVVYGSPGNFQGDLLRHEFELMNTRGDRKYDTVIVDEVDNMLIDDAQHITMLSGPMPGFEYLQGLLLSCWNLLKMLETRFERKNGDLLFMNQEYKKTDEGIFLEKLQDRPNI